MAVVRTDSTIAPRADRTTHRAANALRSLHGLAHRGMRAARRIVACSLAPVLLVALPCLGMQPALAANGAGVGAEPGGLLADGGQNFELVKDAALSFLVQQTEGLPGKVTISLVSAAPRGLTTCGALEPFVPPGVRLWGRAMVGVRCNGERPWTIYLQARIGVIGDYFVAARTLNVGDTIGAQDLEPRHGDLTALPATLVTNPSQVVGAITNNAVTAGFPLRSDMVHAALAIRYGQQVRVVARGDGFAVSSEGSALANAAVGQSVRVRTASGTVISGIAQADTSVEVSM
ncbi:flagellar basal body P-ring formation chaperone FlgA [Robbsia sp. Bb-Pol-6]|uniref:Flagellar basal body P-ring formation chaperone FlgA n=1 Tax=Robbsia betulipollinis TaxID=2981849 RepID=A0ABT3ZHM5_9BURK|nr:flagellar basal body P-ring formation chaperone FlgA [Robbsia betulipollinis]MCY0386018.1 flagellar basal body P-ring formation chaperone FlgA [Robbsia betulipollinis]